LRWESVKEDMISVYTQEFTEQELKKLTAFYQTPVGKKASEKCPNSSSWEDRLASSTPRHIKLSYNR